MKALKKFTNFLFPFIHTPISYLKRKGTQEAALYGKPAVGSLRGPALGALSYFTSKYFGLKSFWAIVISAAVTLVSSWFSRGWEYFWAVRAFATGSNSHREPTFGEILKFAFFGSGAGLEISTFSLTAPPTTSVTTSPSATATNTPLPSPPENNNREKKQEEARTESQSTDGRTSTKLVEKDENKAAASPTLIPPPAISASSPSSSPSSCSTQSKPSEQSSAADYESDFDDEFQECGSEPTPSLSSTHALITSSLSETKLSKEKISDADKQKFTKLHKELAEVDKQFNSLFKAHLSYSFAETWQSYFASFNDTNINEIPVEIYQKTFEKLANAQKKEEVKKTAEKPDPSAELVPNLTIQSFFAKKDLLDKSFVKKNGRNVISESLEHLITSMEACNKKIRTYAFNKVDDEVRAINDQVKAIFPKNASYPFMNIWQKYWPSPQHTNFPQIDVSLYKTAFEYFANTQSDQYLFAKKGENGEYVKKDGKYVISEALEKLLKSMEACNENIKAYSEKHIQKRALTASTKETREAATLAEERARLQAEKENAAANQRFQDSLYESGSRYTCGRQALTSYTQ